MISVPHNDRGLLLLLTFFLSCSSPATLAFQSIVTGKSHRFGVSSIVLPGTTSSTITLDGETLRGPIEPVGNFVLVRNKETLSATSGGILLPDQAKERPTEGLVLAAGPGKIHPHTGVRITNPVGAGDSVLYGKFSGIAMTYNDEQVTMIRDDDILLYYKDSQSITLQNAIPCRDYVLVKIEKSKLTTSSGIVVAEMALKDYENCEGMVAKVGEGRMCSTGEFTASPVNVGERVKFKDYAGNEVKIEGEVYALVRMVDILCTIVDQL